MERYSINGTEGYWRLVRNEYWDRGERSITYGLDFVPLEGDWHQTDSGWDRKPAWAKVRAAILKDWRPAPQAAPKKRKMMRSKAKAIK